VRVFWEIRWLNKLAPSQCHRPKPQQRACLRVQCFRYTAFHHCSSSFPSMDRFLVQPISVSSDATRTELQAAAAPSARRKKQAKDDVCRPQQSGGSAQQVTQAPQMVNRPCGELLGTMRNICMPSVCLCVCGVHTRPVPLPVPVCHVHHACKVPGADQRHD
jgi:hypothetical protein